jgi:hypothetical protein
VYAVCSAGGARRWVPRLGTACATGWLWHPSQARAARRCCAKSCRACTTAQGSPSPVCLTCTCLVLYCLWCCPGLYCCTPSPVLLMKLRRPDGRFAWMERCRTASCGRQPRLHCTARTDSACFQRCAPHYSRVTASVDCLGSRHSRELPSMRCCGCSGLQLPDAGPPAEGKQNAPPTRRGARHSAQDSTPPPARARASRARRPHGPVFGRQVPAPHLRPNLSVWCVSHQRS